jgi:hypothetical protein
MSGDGVGFDVTPTGPVARLLVRALTDTPGSVASPRSPYVPPADGQRSGAGSALPAVEVIERCDYLLRATLGSERFDAHLDWLLPDIVVWTPVSQTQGLTDLLGSTRDLGTTLTEVEIHIVLAEVAQSRVFAEWRLAGRFTEPCFIDDDLLVEPTARLVETAGVLVLAFSDDLVASIHCYFDQLGLLEQLLTSR